MGKITAKKLKKILGRYLPLLLYPQDKRQEKLKFPFTKGYWRRALMEDYYVSEYRIRIMRKNISLHISLLKDIDKQLSSICADTTHTHAEDTSD